MASRTVSFLCVNHQPLGLAHSQGHQGPLPQPHFSPGAGTRQDSTSPWPSDARPAGLTCLARPFPWGQHRPASMLPGQTCSPASRAGTAHSFWGNVTVGPVLSDTLTAQMARSPGTALLTPTPLCPGSRSHAVGIAALAFNLQSQCETFSPAPRGVACCNSTCRLLCTPACPGPHLHPAEPCLCPCPCPAPAPAEPSPLHCGPADHHEASL